MVSRALMSLALVAVLAAPAFASGGDVLDAPAVRSGRAASSLLNGVALAGKRIVCVGQRGNVVYSDDRGKHWSQARVPVQSDLVAVSFPTPTKGWAVGHDGVVLHSDDGGATWAKQFDGNAAARVMVEYYKENVERSRADGGQSLQSLAEEARRYLEQGADKPFLDVWFENDTTGYIVGAFSLIFRTTDGGKSWTPLFDRIDNPKRLHLYAIRPIGQDLYASGEQGSVFKLDRHSGRFKALKTPYKGTFFGIAGKPGAIVAFGMRGNVFLSRDGGVKWRKVETGVPSGLTGGAVTPDGRNVLVSQAGDVLVSREDGASFTPVKTGQPFPANAVTALDGNTLALAGLAGVKMQPIQQ